MNHFSLQLKEFYSVLIVTEQQIPKTTLVNIMNISVRTLENWDSGRNKLNERARIILNLIDNDTYKFVELVEAEINYYLRPCHGFLLRLGLFL